MPLVVLLLAVFGIVNVLAYLHARSMVEWSSAGEPTPRPEALGWPQRLAVLARGIHVPRPVNTRTPADVELVYEQVSMPSGSGHELDAWFVPARHDRVLFVVHHGYTACKEEMLPLAVELHRLGFPCLLVDFYGSGESSGTGTALGVHEAHDVVAAMAYARSRWPDARLVVYGVSMGGAAALRAVAHHDTRPDGLVLEATFDRLLSTVKNRFRVMGVPPTPLAHLLVFWGQRAIGIDGFAHDPATYARAVSCPTLVFRGENDDRVSEREARAVYEQLGGWKRYTSFEDLGHELVAPGAPERWMAEIARLVAEM